MENITIVKIGGNVIDNEKELNSFLKDFSKIKGNKILIHGGGKITTKIAEEKGIKQTLINGRRVTDKETLDIAVMCYAGLINKNIVATLQSNNCNAIGLSGVDANIITSVKRKVKEIDYGFVGDIENINTNIISQFISMGLTMVISPITHNENGQLLNTNADTIAQEIATGLSKLFNVTLVYSFEKNGLLFDVNDDNTLIKNLTYSKYKELLNSNVIVDGMIPKMENAFDAINNGVEKVIIGKATSLEHLLLEMTGTTLSKENDI